MAEHSLTIDREIEDIEQQVRRELDTIQDLLASSGYRASIPDWNVPFQIHRLRRALRIHYLALKIREGTPLPSATDEMIWDLPTDVER